MFASRFPSCQLSKNASFPTVEKRLVLHYTSAAKPLWLCINISLHPLVEYVRFERELSHLLGRKVELTVNTALLREPRFAERVCREAVAI